jgi:hypothetical protein
MELTSYSSFAMVGGVIREVVFEEAAGEVVGQMEQLNSLSQCGERPWALTRGRWSWVRLC